MTRLGPGIAEISTTFSNVVEGSDQFALEWSSKAKPKDDRPIEYRHHRDRPRGRDDRAAARLLDSAVFTLVPAGTG